MSIWIKFILAALIPFPRSLWMISTNDSSLWKLWNDKGKNTNQTISTDGKYWNNNGRLKAVCSSENYKWTSYWEVFLLLFEIERNLSQLNFPITSFASVTAALFIVCFYIESKMKLVLHAEGIFLSLFFFQFSIRTATWS